jgi:hypothetical protein
VTAAVLPGDVILVRTGSLSSAMIRLGAALRDAPNLANHVAVIDHTDLHGTVWCIEGRPGGVGWRDASAYLASPWRLDNAAQPKTPPQRAAICAAMHAMLGTPYDWTAIVADGADDLRIRLPWEPVWHGTVPGHVVCSSAAWFAYGKAGLAAPPGGRECQPSDWDQFILTRAWEEAK